MLRLSQAPDSSTKGRVIARLLEVSLSRDANRWAPRAASLQSLPTDRRPQEGPPARIQTGRGELPADREPTDSQARCRSHAERRTRGLVSRRRSLVVLLVLCFLETQLKIVKLLRAQPPDTGRLYINLRLDSREDLNVLSRSGVSLLRKGNETPVILKGRVVSRDGYVLEHLWGGKALAPLL